MRSLALHLFFVTDYHLVMIQIDGLSEKGIRDSDVLLFEEDHDRQAVDDDKAGKCARVGDDCTHLRHKQGKGQGDQRQDQVEDDQVALLHWLVLEEQVQQLGPEEQVEHWIGGEEHHEHCQAHHECLWLRVTEHIEAVLVDLTLVGRLADSHEVVLE